MNPLIQLKTTPPLLITLALLCFGLLPRAHAVFPPPDGGYPNFNTAEGQKALFSLTTGQWNTALGAFTLWRNTDGSYNTAVGTAALLFNIGNQSAGEGVENTAVGAAALLLNTTGSDNTAVGAAALLNNVGILNTATGASALHDNTTGGFNTAHGKGALLKNTGGSFNTAHGNDALVNNTTGSFNTAIGFQAGGLITGSGNVCIGYQVAGVAGESNTTRIRNVHDSVATARAVYVNSDNKIGTLSSSRRYKDEIRPMAKASEAILSLRPVSFRYKKEVDPTRSLSFGLIAEEVAEVDPDLVTRHRYGKPETVRYEAVNAMLLNEFLKEHRKVEELQATVEEQKKEMHVVLARLEEQAAQLQRMTGRLAAANPSRGGLEATKFAKGRIRGGGPAPQVVLNDQ